MRAYSHLERLLLKVYIYFRIIVMEQYDHDSFEWLRSLDPASPVPHPDYPWEGADVAWGRLEPFTGVAKNPEGLHLSGDHGVLAQRPHGAVEWRTSTAAYHLEAFGPELVGYASYKQGALHAERPFLEVDNVGLRIERKGDDETRYQPVDEGWLVYDSFRLHKRLRRVGMMVFGGYGFMPGNKLRSLEVVRPPRRSRLG